MKNKNINKVPDYLRQPDLKRQYNEQLFSRIAARYDLLNKILSFGLDAKWKRTIASMLPATDIRKCLDVACGTGDMTALLAKKYQKAKVHALDLTADMINIARKKKDCENVEFVLGDMCAMPFDDNCFDAVTACYAIRNAPDLYKSLDEIIRVTRPGGYVCLMEFSKPANKFLQMMELFALKLWCGLWSWLFYRDCRPYGYIVPSLRALPDSKQLKDILTLSGCEIISSRKQAFGMIKIILCKKR